LLKLESNLWAHAEHIARGERFPSWLHGIGMRKKLGEMLIEEGIITEEQLNTALEEQRKQGNRIGTNLINLGMATSQQITELLGKQYQVPSIDLSAQKIDPAILELIPPEVAMKYQLIPVKKQGKSLTLAMANPMDVFAIDDVRFTTGLRITPMVCAELLIKEHLDKYYHSEDLETKVMEGLKDIGLELVSEDNGEEELGDVAMATSNGPVVQMVNHIISEGVGKRASDIHIEPYERELRIRYRIDGALHEAFRPPYKYKGAIISRIKIISKMRVEEKRRPQDGRVKIKVRDKVVDLRVATVPTLYGEKVALRVLDRTAISFDLNVLGVEEQPLQIFLRSIKNPNGIVLVTGPTGCGKTTTLYAALNQINDPKVNITTAEDPVEFGMTGINQLHVRESIGLTFASALRSFLRQDPDIIMVGEIRDRETAEIAIRASLTGHLVLSTVHTNTAAATITRLINMGIEPFLIASTLIMVVSQRLLRVLCPHCREAYEPPPELFAKTRIDPASLGGTLYRGRGCQECHNSGYKNRVGIFEVMPVTPAIRRLIIQRSTTGKIEEKAIEEGMVTLRDAALLKLRAGITDLTEALKETAVE